ncbi:hypothetical protein ABT075_42445 [Streptomyces sp. NPDC002677]|uniref:hypothetical protein n=1 Tax=Streptomyces sp. NPDC002677 TaxID=3154774 RepID=UPI00331DAFA7
MDNNGEQELTVYYRHLAAILRRSDDDNFDALMDQADHVTRRSYETTLQDHQQTFRLLWQHLERSGYLRRIHREARARLTAGDVPPAEGARLELFLTVYAGVRATSTRNA